MSITKQFMIIVLLSIVAVFVSLSVVSTWNLNGALKAKYTEVQRDKANAICEYIKVKNGQFHSSCRVMTDGVLCRNLMETEDPDTIQDGFVPFLSELKLARMCFGDFDGEFLVALESDQEDFNEQERKLVERAMDGEEITPIIVRDPLIGVQLVTAAVVGQVDDPIGVVVLYKKLDATYAASISKIYGTDVQIMDEQDVWLSSTDFDDEYIASNCISTAIPMTCSSGLSLRVINNTDAIKSDQQKALTDILMTSSIVTIVVLIAVVLYIRHLKGRIQALLAGLFKNINELHHISEETNSASTQISDSIQRQAEDVLQITGSLGGVVESATHNCKEAGEANVLIAEVGETVDAGVKSVAQMAERVEEIEKSAMQISTVLSTLEEISFQTNLLALNASVEAARAGEAGKGFAVVAEEVRALARRSAEAAKETSALINEAQGNAKNGVSASKDVLKRINDIRDHMGAIVVRINSINESGQEQQVQVSQIDGLMNNMSDQSQNNAKLSNSTQQMSEELAQYAHVLFENSEKIAHVIIGSVKQQ